MPNRWQFILHFGLVTPAADFIFRRMKRLLPSLSLCTFLSLLPAASTRASTLISNLGQPTVTAAEGFADTTIRYAWDFQTGASPADVTALTLRLLNLDLISHHITSQLWTNSGSNQPGAFVAAFPDISIAAGTFPPTDLTATSPGIPLAAGTIYWIVTGMGEALVNSPFGPGHELVSSGQTMDAGGVFSTVASTNFLFSGDSGATWSLSATENAFFKLEGTVVPEPSGAFLLLSTAIPILLRRRR